LFLSAQSRTSLDSFDNEFSAFDPQPKQSSALNNISPASISRDSGLSTSNPLLYDDETTISLVSSTATSDTVPDLQLHPTSNKSGKIVLKAHHSQLSDISEGGQSLWEEQAKLENGSVSQGYKSMSPTENGAAKTGRTARERISRFHRSKSASGDSQMDSIEEQQYILISSDEEVLAVKSSVNAIASSVDAPMSDAGTTISVNSKSEPIPILENQSVLRTRNERLQDANDEVDFAYKPKLAVVSNLQNMTSSNGLLQNMMSSNGLLQNMTSSNSLLQNTTSSNGPLQNMTSSNRINHNSVNTTAQEKDEVDGNNQSKPTIAKQVKELNDRQKETVTKTTADLDHQPRRLMKSDYRSLFGPAKKEELTAIESDFVMGLIMQMSNENDSEKNITPTVVNPRQEVPVIAGDNLAKSHASRSNFASRHEPKLMLVKPDTGSTVVAKQARRYLNAPNSEQPLRTTVSSVNIDPLKGRVDTRNRNYEDVIKSNVGIQYRNSLSERPERIVSLSGGSRTTLFATSSEALDRNNVEVQHLTRRHTDNAAMTQRKRDAKQHTKLQDVVVTTERYEWLTVDQGKERLLQTQKTTSENKVRVGDRDLKKIVHGNNSLNRSRGKSFESEIIRDSNRVENERFRHQSPRLLAPLNVNMKRNEVVKLNRPEQEEFQMKRSELNRINRSEPVRLRPLEVKTNPRTFKDPEPQSLPVPRSTQGRKNNLARADNVFEEESYQSSSTSWSNSLDRRSSERTQKPVRGASGGYDLSETNNSPYRGRTDGRPVERTGSKSISDYIKRIENEDYEEEVRRKATSGGNRYEYVDGLRYNCKSEERERPDSFEEYGDSRKQYRGSKLDYRNERENRGGQRDTHGTDNHPRNDKKRQTSSDEIEINVFIPSVLMIERPDAGEAEDGKQTYLKLSLRDHGNTTHEFVRGQRGIDNVKGEKMRPYAEAMRRDAEIDGEKRDTYKQAAQNRELIPASVNIRLKSTKDRGDGDFDRPSQRQIEVTHRYVEPTNRDFNISKRDVEDIVHANREQRLNDRQFTETIAGEHQIQSSSRDANRLVNSSRDANRSGSSRETNRLGNLPRDFIRTLNSSLDATRIVNSPRDTNRIGNSPRDANRIINSPRDANRIGSFPRDANRVVNSPRDTDRLVNSSMDNNRTVNSPRDNNNRMVNSSTGDVIRPERNITTKKQPVENQSRDYEVLKKYRDFEIPRNNVQHDTRLPVNRRFAEVRQENWAKSPRIHSADSTREDIQQVRGIQQVRDIQQVRGIQQVRTAKLAEKTQTPLAERKQVTVVKITNDCSYISQKATSPQPEWVSPSLRAVRTQSIDRFEDAQASGDYHYGMEENFDRDQIPVATGIVSRLRNKYSQSHR